MKIRIKMPFITQHTLPVSKWIFVYMLLVVQIPESCSQYSHTQTSPQTNRPIDQPQCRCNNTEIFTELPYVIQELGRDDRFEWAFQGRKGDRGEDGPQGVEGQPGRDGKEGLKGERGEQGPRGLPGTSMVHNARGSFIGSEKGERGPRGVPGKQGYKGEPGVTFSTVLKDGSYFEVKGQKGDRGGRGRKGIKGELGETGLPGRQGLSIQGQKGEKGEPAILPDIELLRGLPGVRGPPGLPGYPGIGCAERIQLSSQADSNGSNNSCANRPVVVPLKGERGDRGIPGLSLMGEKGDVGPQGPPGPPGNIPDDITSSMVFESTTQMQSQRRPLGTIAFIKGNDQAYIKVANGWREIELGSFYPEELNKFVGDKFSFSQFNKDGNDVDEYYRYDDDSTPRKQYFAADKPKIKHKYRNRNFNGRHRRNRQQIEAWDVTKN